MLTELIPVLEIGYQNQRIDIPEQYPYWEHPEVWQDFADKSLKKAGFKDQFIPYSKGSSFYRALEISDENLIKIINDHFDIYVSSETEWDEERVTALIGGYVLRVNSQDKLFPQCCSDLSDIVYWEAIAKYGQAKFYNGHPAPEIVFENENVVILCEDHFESFVPITDERIVVPKTDLLEAYESAILELQEFERKLNRIKSGLDYLPIQSTLGEILIYRNWEINIEKVKKESNQA